MSDNRHANDRLPTLDMSKTLVDHAPANAGNAGNAANAGNAGPSIDETARHTPIAKSISAKGKKRASVAPPSMTATSVSKLAAKATSLPKIPVAAKVEVDEAPEPLAPVRARSTPPATQKTATLPPPASKRTSKIPPGSKMPIGSKSPASLSKMGVGSRSSGSLSKMAIGTRIDRPRRLSVPPPPPVALADSARPTLASSTPSKSRTPEDQVSIPPASDLGSHGALATAETVRLDTLRPAPMPRGEVDPRHAHVPGTGSGAAFQRNMKIAVGLVAVAALAMFVRVGIAKYGRAPTQAAHVAAAAPPPAGPQLPPPPPIEQVTEPAPVVPAKTATEEKKASLAALEKRDLAEATAAGERSVDLDPTDADAWRVLGAAYQDMGRLAEARHCFAECAKVAKKGEVRECSFLLH